MPINISPLVGDMSHAELVQQFEFLVTIKAASMSEGGTISSHFERMLERTRMEILKRLGKVADKPPF